MQSITQKIISKSILLSSNQNDNSQTGNKITCINAKCNWILRYDSDDISDQIPFKRPLSIYGISSMIQDLEKSWLSNDNIIENNKNLPVIYNKSIAFSFVNLKILLNSYRILWKLNQRFYDMAKSILEIWTDEIKEDLINDILLKISVNSSFEDSKFLSDIYWLNWYLFTIISNLIDQSSSEKTYLAFQRYLFALKKLKHSLSDISKDLEITEKNTSAIKRIARINRLKAFGLIANVDQITNFVNETIWSVTEIAERVKTLNV